VSRFDWSLVDDGPPRLSSWSHNAPSPRFRVKLVARQ
jgi:hypothetical protein